MIAQGQVDISIGVRGLQTAINLIVAESYSLFDNTLVRKSMQLKRSFYVHLEICRWIHHFAEYAIMFFSSGYIEIGGHGSFFSIYWHQVWLCMDVAEIEVVKALAYSFKRHA